jgi:hexosaminidase
MKSIRNLTISSLFKVFTIVLIAFFATGVSTNAQQKEKTISDFRVKGFHLDLRIQVMTMPALKEFAKELADFGMNTLVMEWEGTYPYEKHATISNKYAYTRDEVKEFVAYCDSLGIDVIPLQQCFGHVEYILRHGRYNHLRESRNDLSQVCPLKMAGNKQLFTELFKDMAMLHTSEYIHIGGDETRLLGHCAQCSKKVAAEGTSKLFSDYLIMLCNQVVTLGKKPVIWADMVLKYPDVVDYLPKETVYVDWNYGWDINYFGNVGDLLKKDANFWGAPAIRSHPDNWYSIDWEKHFNNLCNYIPYAREAGYQGIVMTSWSTSGVYGYTWDTNMEVIDLHAMRNVYPLSGFRILIAAYVQALNQSEPLDPENFVKKYAKHRFGLKKEGGEGLWSVLRTSQKIIKFQNPSDTQELDSINKMVKQAEKVMAAIKPSKHQKEFEHLKLMLDMRSFYLDIKKVESFYESGQYTSATAKDLLPELERLLVESKILDDRFMQLNEGYLYPEEIKEQNEIRNRQLQNLYEAVTKARTGLESLKFSAKD